MTRIALGLRYDGEPWHGWQTQPGGRGVQDQLEHALAVFVGTRVPTICAGRTDTGVHATLQVVHCDVEVERPWISWVRGLNSHLPASVAVRWACAVPEDFHARFSARERTYHYLLLDDPVRDPFWHGRVGWTHRELDVEAMQAAANHWVGEHDFTSFRASQCQAASPVRTLKECSLHRHGRLVVLRLRANAFLHHMVRNLVGTLVYVGQGRKPPEWAAEVLAARNRAVAAPTFAAGGLYLTGVSYPGFDLPQVDAAADVPGLAGAF